MVGNLLVAVFLILALAWNVTTVSAFTLPAGVRQAGFGPGLHQAWEMFSPGPPRATEWYLLVGTLDDRQRVNLVPALASGNIARAPALTWERPEDIGSNYYGDKSWRKYLDAIARPSTTGDQRRLAAYACRTWNGHGEGRRRLTSVQLVAASEPTLPGGEAGDLAVRELERFTCS